MMYWSHKDTNLLATDSEHVARGTYPVKTGFPWHEFSLFPELTVVYTYCDYGANLPLPNSKKGRDFRRPISKKESVFLKK